MILPVVLTTWFLSTFTLHVGIADDVTRNNTLTRRVIGGHIVPYNKHPFMAAVLINKGGVTTSCCGSIIADQWILTAAHCMARVRARQVTVCTGDKRYASGECHQVQDVVVHPNYDGDNNDIALIHLQTIVTKGEIVELATTDTPNNTKCTIVGWGVSNRYASTRSDPDLREVNVYTTSCDNTFLMDSTNLDRFNKNSILCTSTKTGLGACWGDSGGPLVIKNIQIGVVSNGVPPCAVGEPDIFTNVVFYQQWIHTTMRDYN